MENVLIVLGNNNKKTKGNMVSAKEINAFHTLCKRSFTADKIMNL